MDKYTRIISRLSLKKQLILCIMLFLVLPLILAELIINHVVSYVIFDNVCRNRLASLKQSNATLSNIINDTEYISLAFITDDRVISLLDNIRKNKMDEVAKEHFDITRGRGDMQKFFESRPYISSASIYDEEGIYLQYHDPVTKESSEFNRHATELKGRAIWTPLYALPNRLLDNGKPRYVISVVRAVIDTNSFKQIAYSRISIDEETICNTFKDFNVSPGEKIFIVNSKGMVVSSTDKSMLMKDINSELWLKSALQNNEGYSEILFGGKKYKEIHYEIPKTSWYVIQIIPKQNLAREITTINIFIAMSIGLCFIFLILFLIIQNNSIVKPIKILVREMEKIKKGIFDIDIRDYSLRKDEIGVLNSVFIDMVDRINILINKVYKSEIAEKEAKLISLESQINPHFLYNTLDSLRWDVINKGDYESAEQLKALADVFRHVLNKGKEMTTIREEINHLRNYIKIQENRFGDRISFEIEVDDNLLDCNTIKLILQPLVENSIKHGLEKKVGRGRVHISIKKIDNKILYSVIDDGVGSDQKEIKEMLADKIKSHNVFALKNIQERIQLKFGMAYGLEFYSHPNCGTKVEVKIPYIRGEEVKTEE